MSESSHTDEVAVLSARVSALEETVARLTGENTLLREENALLREENARLRGESDDLRRRVEEAERCAHRQAAPFRVPEARRKADPKKPGRGPGHAGSFRARPDYIDERIEVALERCPKCQGPLEKVRPVEQRIEEIPLVRPHVTHLTTYVGRCACCGKVRSTHPLQVSTATGAAGTHLGPRALALGLELIYGRGLTRRKACAVLRDFAGLRITPGGLVHAGHRLAEKLRMSYEELIEHLRKSAMTHVDETSWWVGAPKWWLWVFTRPDTTVYRVEQGRGRAVVQEVLGADFPGLLVSDCLAVYDDATPHQHKCYAHHLKAIKTAWEEAGADGRPAIEKLRAVLKAAMAFKKVLPDLRPADAAGLRASLETHADTALAEARGSPGAAKVARRIEKQRDHLFAFLDVPEAESTNNLAERQLRPAVIARKVSCGNKTPLGATTWQILASLIATRAQRRQLFAPLVAQALALTCHQQAR